MITGKLSSCIDTHYVVFTDKPAPALAMEMEMATVMTSASVAVKLGMFFFSSSTFVEIGFGILTCYKPSPS